MNIFIRMGTKSRGLVSLLSSNVLLFVLQDAGHAERIVISIRIAVQLHEACTTKVHRLLMSCRVKVRCFTFTDIPPVDIFVCNFNAGMPSKINIEHDVLGN
jgi:hypothetical protein